MQSLGVLLLAYGGPNTLDDIPAFLREVRGGQSVPQPLIDETTRRYRLIGGYSPLLTITRQLASRLQNAIEMPVYIGMRHSSPYIADTVREMAQDRITHATVICLAPHYSRMSIGAYRAKLDEAVQTVIASRETAKQPPNFDFIESWHRQARYVEGVANNVRVALARFSTNPKIIFTAHSLPVSAREPYESHLRETAQLVTQNLVLPDERWMLCYQSKPRASGDWLEPLIENVIPQLALTGEKNVVIAPIGFVADHLEVLYDLDISVRDLACAKGVRVVRTPMLNDSDALVAALAELVKERNRQSGMRET
ncbi:protoporphyrin/coproporphyrin ferrochelatase [Gammaproteobacteria bacterium]|nr:protoporphyrin/coproporphyrin ferrochelatase [Gammaproteobacteria bacterium]